MSGVPAEAEPTVPAGATLITFDNNVIIKTSAPSDGADFYVFRSSYEIAIDTCFVVDILRDNDHYYLHADLNAKTDSGETSDAQQVLSDFVTRVVKACGHDRDINVRNILVTLPPERYEFRDPSLIGTQVHLTIDWPSFYIREGCMQVILNLTDLKLLTSPLTADLIVPVTLIDPSNCPKLYQTIDDPFAVGFEIQPAAEK